jgi:hypothetical protein
LGKRRRKLLHRRSIYVHKCNQFLLILGHYIPKDTSYSTLGKAKVLKDDIGSDLFESLARNQAAREWEMIG